MEVYKNISWEHGGKEYEIRIMLEDKLINILPFHKNHPANGFRYQIQLSKNVKTQSLLKLENFTHIIENVKEDIKKERWQLFLEHEKQHS